MRKTTVSVILIGLVLISMCRCGGSKSSLNDEVDSLSYALGVNLGTNMYKLDSTLNVDVLCQAIRDTWRGKGKMTVPEARTYFLAQKTYFVHEKAKAYEEKLLADIAKSDKSWVRTKSGVTYRITHLGDQSIQSMNIRDTVSIFYSMWDESGKPIREHDSLRAAYRDLISGLQDVVKATGDGGKFEAWVPYEEAYGANGNEKLGVKPYQTLRYTIDSMVIKYNNADSRR